MFAQINTTQFRCDDAPKEEENNKGPQPPTTHTEQDDDTSLVLTDRQRAIINAMAARHNPK